MAATKKTLAEMMHSIIDDSAGTKKAFHTKARTLLRNLARKLELQKGEFTVKTNKGGAGSGEVILHADHFYVQVAQTAGPGDVLYRRCKGQKDFTGGTNCWAQAADLDDVESFAARMTRDLDLACSETDDTPTNNDYRDIPLGMLRLSEKNARIAATDEEADRQLAAHIAKRGIVQNLIVYEHQDGNFEVVGGGRRLAALKSLGRPDDFPVHCQVEPEAIAIELSAAENLQRSQMHPADEAEAFRRMVREESRDIEDVAALFGLTVRLVQQRLKLASLSPDLLQKFRSGAIKLEWAMALTLSDRHEDQENAWKQVSHYPDWQDRSAAIKRVLSQDKIRGDDPLAVFVGLETYKQAGGTVDEDLFSDPADPASILLADAPLLRGLAHNRLEETAAKLRDQWRWAEARGDFSEHETWTTYSQEFGELPSLPDDLAEEDRQVEARLDRLYELHHLNDRQMADITALEHRRDQIEAWPAANAHFSDEQRQKVGCVVTLDDTGQVKIYQGLVRKEDQPKGDPATDNAVPGASTHSSSTPGTAGGPPGSSNSDQAEADPSPGISAVLGQDLGAYRTLCLRAALAKDPDLARDFLLWILAGDVLTPRHRDSPTAISARPETLRSSQDDLKDLAAAGEIAQIMDKLPRSFSMLPEKDQPAKLRTMLPEEKDALLAACVGMSLTQRAAAPSQPRNPVLDFLQTELGGDRVIAALWRPTAGNFFGRIKAADALAIGEEVLGRDWANRHRNDKKGPLCKALERAFAAGDDDVEGVTPEARARAASWLPPGMRLAEEAEDDRSVDEEKPAEDLPDFLAEGGEAEAA